MKKTSIYAHAHIDIAGKSFKPGDVVATLESDLDTQQLVTVLTNGSASDTPYVVPPTIEAIRDASKQKTAAVEMPRALAGTK